MKEMFAKNMMYMLAAVMVPLFVLLVANVGGMEPAQVEIAPWYEIEGDVLTVRLPVGGDVEKWIFGVSDPALLELITQEYPENAQTYVASFRNFSDESGMVVLTLHGLDVSEQAVDTRSLTLNVGDGLAVD